MLHGIWVNHFGAWWMMTGREANTLRKAADPDHMALKAKYSITEKE